MALLGWVAWRYFLRPAAEPGELLPFSLGRSSGKLRVRALNQLGIVYAAVFAALGALIRLRVLLWLVAMLSVSALVVLLTLLFSRNDAALDWLGRQADVPDVLRTVFSAERLVPPPPLPPQVFADAVALQPALGGADHDWSKLDPQFEQRVLRLLQRMQERGYPLVLLEGYRSPERQDALLRSGSGVTQAAGGQSKHQYGLAADLAPLHDGKVVISAADPWAASAYEAMGEEAAASGLFWGGRWHFRDLGHVEWPGSLSAWVQANKTEKESSGL